MRSLSLVFLALLGAGEIAAQETSSYYTDSLSIRVIGDSLLPNGKRYFVLNKPAVPRGRFVRTDSSYIYYCREWDSVDVLFYNCGANLGDSWHAGIDPTATVGLERIDSLTILGQRTKVLRFTLDGLMLFEAALANGFGPVEYYSPGEPPGTEYTTWSLVGCILSGIQYGRLTAVAEGPQAPAKFELFQNFPNPFNPTTTIRYAVPEKGWVRIWVYDVLGRIVRQLLDGETYPGAYETTWDGRDEQGHQVASGVYLYQLQFHPSTNRPPLLLTGKMILLR
jgi:hypothetical protein